MLFYRFLFLLSVLSLLRVFQSDFVNYDDPQYVRDNIYIKQFTVENVKSIFKGDATILYVPLTVFSYLIEHTLFGGKPAVFHFFNLLFHILNAILLLRILQRLKVNETLTYFILIFFSIHPLVTESVCWITERKDVLYTLFYFLSALQFLKFQEDKNHRTLFKCFLLFILACLSKPMALSLPVLFSIYILYKNRSFKFKEHLKLSHFYLGSFAFAIISIMFIGSRTMSVQGLSAYSVTDKLYLVVSEIGFYFFKPFVPFNQQLIHPFPTTTELFSNANILVFFFLGVVLLGVVSFFVIKKKNWTILALFAAWLVMLLPVLQVYPNTHSYVSERYFYLTIIFPVAITYLVLGLEKKNISSFKYVLPVLAICFGILTFKRSGVWKNSMTLFEAELKVDPNDHYALNNLGEYYNSVGNFEKAKPLLEKAISFERNNGIYLNNYGWALAATGQKDSAEKYLRKATRFTASRTQAMNNLGVYFMNVNKTDSAFRYFELAYKTDPNNNEVLYNLGAYYLKIGDREKARLLIRRAHELGNKSAQKYLNY